MKFAEEFNKRASGSVDTVYGAVLYDVIWALALALNNTMTMVNANNINGTNCIEVSGSLVPLENFTYANEMMGCLIQWNLQHTSFSGISVSS